MAKGEIFTHVKQQMDYPPEQVKVSMELKVPAITSMRQHLDWGVCTFFRADPVGWVSALNSEGERLYVASSDVLTIKVKPVRKTDG